MVWVRLLSTKYQSYFELGGAVRVQRKRRHTVYAFVLRSGYWHRIFGEKSKGTGDICVSMGGKCSDCIWDERGGAFYVCGSSAELVSGSTSACKWRESRWRRKRRLFIHFQKMGKWRPYRMHIPDESDVLSGRYQSAWWHRESSADARADRVLRRRSR